VPVEPGSEALWTHPPFAGHVADGAVWGRGAIDDKASLMAILEAVELLLAQHIERPGHACANRHTGRRRTELAVNRSGVWQS
jgi:acetylornithine deacetylase/succinyl-diaminopimelate desuccinylase-like protein